MSTISILLVCIQACLLQNVYSQCLAGPGLASRNWAGPLTTPLAPAGPGLGYGAPGIAGAGLGWGAGAAAPLAAPALGYGWGAGIAGPAAGPAAGCGAAYGGAGAGNVAVAGELPVGGATSVAGQVPIIGAVEFGGAVPALGTVIITGSCACGCGAWY